MRARVVTSLREFDALGPLWRDVLDESGDRSPFLSHDWFATCWRSAGPNRQREVTILEDSAGPVALFPLVRWRTTRHGVPLRVLSFLDTPDVPFNNFIVARGVEEAVETLVAGLIARDDWDVLSLTRFSGDSAILKTLEAVADGQMPCRILGHERLPHLSVHGRWDDYMAQRGAEFAATQEQICNRLHEAGRVTIDEYQDLDPDGPVFAELMDLSRHLWKVPTRVAVLTARGMPRFFRELTPRFAATDALRVWMLRLDGRAVAAEYQFAVGDSVYALRGDGDPTTLALQPWCALTARIVRALFDRGVRHYHMGHPGMTHKFAWGTGTHETVTFEAYAPTRYGRLLHGLEVHLMPLARQLRKRVSGGAT